MKRKLLVAALIAGVVTGLAALAAALTGPGTARAAYPAPRPSVTDFQFIKATTPTEADCEAVGRTCFTPQAIQSAYNLGPLYDGHWDGKGITIAIVDSYGSDTMAHDLHVFNQAFNLDPTHEGVAVQFVDTLRNAGDKANAFKVAQFAVERGNESPRVIARLASLMLEHDQFDEAEPFLRRAIEEGKVPSAYGDLANVLWDRDGGAAAGEDREEALTLLRAAVDLPTLAKSTLDILLDLHEEEKNEEATKLLLRAAEKHPTDATVLRTGPYTGGLQMACALETEDASAIRSLCETFEMELEDVNRALLRVLADLHVERKS
jgi:tetratricopeptide (TPR) repeat protein